MKVDASRKTAVKYATVLFIVALAGFTRWQAVHKLPVDFDEMVYLPAAFRYEEMLASGNWSKIIHYGENLEHPPLNKLLFAIDLRVKKPAEPDWDSLKIGRPIPSEAKPAFTGPRLISAVGGTLQVLLVAIVHPIAGLLLALDTYHTKYSAQVYLEGVPGLMSILAVLLFERLLPKKEEQESRQFRWKLLVVSAIALGLAAAGKYLYADCWFRNTGISHSQNAFFSGRECVFVHRPVHVFCGGSFFMAKSIW